MFGGCERHAAQDLVEVVGVEIRIHLRRALGGLLLLSASTTCFRLGADLVAEFLRDRLATARRNEKVAFHACLRGHPSCLLRPRYVAREVSRNTFTSILER